jgi:Predicted hydrolases or acyltransferases (alpha/beta hydrolase superfamily)
MRHINVINNNKNYNISNSSTRKFKSIFQQCKFFSSLKHDEAILSFKATSLDTKWKIPMRIHRPSRFVQNQPMTKPPILLISGWAGVSMDWGSFPKMIASRTKRDIITYDARGLGNSEYQPPRVGSPSFSAAAAAGGGLLVEEEGESHVLSLDLMALDALAVLHSYYEYLEQEGYSETMIVGREEGGKGGFAQEHDATKYFVLAEYQWEGWLRRLFLN